MLTKTCFLQAIKRLDEKNALSDHMTEERGGAERAARQQNPRTKQACSSDHVASA